MCIRLFIYLFYFWNYLLIQKCLVLEANAGTLLNIPRLRDAGYSNSHRRIL